VNRSTLLCVLDNARHHAGSIGDKSGFATTSGPDSESGLTSAKVLRPLPASRAQAYPLFIPRGCGEAAWRLGVPAL